MRAGPLTPGPSRGRRRVARAALAALALVVPLPGCGLGEGESSGGEAVLTVTRDYGAERLVEATEESPPATETVLRLLDRETELSTRYGGGFVQSIDGISGATEDGRRLDWFFYVNGVESPLGSTEVEVSGGDRIWWDYHDWTNLMRVPAVVGSFPEPFLNGAGEPVEVTCADEDSRAPCEEVVDRLRDQGADAEVASEGASSAASTASSHGGEPSVVVGPWDAVRRFDDDVELLEIGPARSHVFAGFERSGGAWELALLDQTTAERERLRAGSGLIAALGDGRPPLWLVTGTDDEGTAAAAEAFDVETLRDRFAVAIPPDREPLPLPLP